MSDRNSVCNANTSQVAANTAAVTILAANGNRNGMSVYNTGDDVLYLLLDNLGTIPTVSATVFTVAIPALTGYYEMPYNYQGIIKGIWGASATTGGAKVTEFSI